MSSNADGANEYRLFFSIVLPNIRPAIATLLVLFSLEYWNNLLWPLIVFRSDDKFPLAVGIAALVNTSYRPACCPPRQPDSAPEITANVPTLVYPLAANRGWLCII